MGEPAPQQVHLTARQHSRVLDEKWAYGGFHLDPECSNLCKSDTRVEITADVTHHESRSWRTSVYVAGIELGFVCHLCWLRAKRARARCPAQTS